MQDSALFRYLAVTTHIQITMGKSTHFIGQPLYSQVIKLLCKSKILQISEDLGGERYTKRFNAWIHLVVIEELTQKGVIYVTKMKKSLNYTATSDTMYQNPDGLMEVRIQDVRFTKKISKEQTIVHNARIITYADTRKHKLISLLTNDMDSVPEDIIAIYRQRWEIELLFKQIKQNFPLK